MSMISAQCDKLRTAAQTERTLGCYELEQMLLDAADTITELRDERDCVGVAAYETGCRDGSVHYELEHCPACNNIADLQEALEENAKLRELVADMWNDMSVCYEQHVRISSSDMRFYGDRLRKLGIEVGE